MQKSLLFVQPLLQIIPCRVRGLQSHVTDTLWHYFCYTESFEFVFRGQQSSAPPLGDFISSGYSLPSGGSCVYWGSLPQTSLTTLTAREKGDEKWQKQPKDFQISCVSIDQKSISWMILSIIVHSNPWERKMTLPAWGISPLHPSSELPWLQEQSTKLRWTHSLPANKASSKSPFFKTFCCQSLTIFCQGWINFLVRLHSSEEIFLCTNIFVSFAKMQQLHLNLLLE